MSSAVLVAAHWPPAPSVEDESESLAREVTGWSEEQNDDAPDGQVPCRGSVDQYPIILPADSRGPNGPSREGQISRPHPPTTCAPGKRIVNRVRFADSTSECTWMHPHEARENIGVKRADFTAPAESHSLDANQSCFTNSPPSPGEHSPERRPSSWCLPREESSYHDCTDHVLEWYSDDELPSLHRGQSWSNSPPHATRTKKRVNFRLVGEEPPPYSHPGEQADSPSVRANRGYLRFLSDCHRLEYDDVKCQVTARMSQSTSSSPQNWQSAQDRNISRPYEPQSVSRSTNYSSLRPRSSTEPTRLSCHRQPDIDAMYLLPCPKSIPMADDHDWYTIIGLSHLEICRSCMNQIGRSRFRSLFIRSAPKPPGTLVRCALSDPWARLAWIQTVKLGLNHLELLYQITRPTPDGDRCPGWSSAAQIWYRISDPDTGRSLPDFNACAPCFRKLRILMPSVRGGFRCEFASEKVSCDLWTKSPRFFQYIDLLETAATRSLFEPDGYVDLRDLIRYARRKSTIDDCPRDNLRIGAWHYIPELPEFTICEDCYDDIVWPISHHPIANRISRTVKYLPGSRRNPNGTQQASCQLYSPRMRAIFREAVRQGDFSYLKAAALKRYRAERCFRERKKALLGEVARGFDRDAQLRRNADEWKHHE
ncbi:hypothetical protein VTO42DRAFT_1226 [Malbranchea cinnamomea]